MCHGSLHVTTLHSIDEAHAKLNSGTVVGASADDMIMIVHTYTLLLDVKGISRAEVFSVTFSNLRTVFPLPSIKREETQ